MRRFNRLIGILFLTVLNVHLLFSQGRYHSLTIADAVKDSITSGHIVPADLKVNPYLLPPVFQERFLFGTTIDNPSVLNDKSNVFPLLQPRKLKLSDQHFVDSMRLNAYRDYMNTRIDKVKYTKSYIDNVDPAIPELESNIFRKIFEVDIDAGYDDIDPIRRILPKQRYWSTSGSSLIQFSENYISDNWYKGGTGNLNLISVQKFSANYRKNKISINNSFEWKLSFYTDLSKRDSLKLKIGEDSFRIYSDFGIKAVNKWSYSTNIEIKTQLFHNRNDDTGELISAPLSPIYLNMGILGMKYSLDKSYKKNKYKKLKLSADISPLSVQYTYVANKDVDPARYGIEEGKRYLLDLGSTINAGISINFNRNVSFSSRFKYFTSYHKVVMESENELNLTLSRFFSTRLYVYVRFDDTSPDTKIDKFGYFQLNEVFSFGFNYKW